MNTIEWCPYYGWNVLCVDRNVQGSYLKSSLLECATNDATSIFKNMLTYNANWYAGLNLWFSLMQTLAIEWYVTRLDVLQNRDLKDTCCEEIGLCIQNEDVILSSKLNTVGKVYVISGTKRRILSLMQTYNFGIPTPTFDTFNTNDTSWFTIANRMGQFAFSSNHQKCMWSWACLS